MNNEFTAKTVEDAINLGLKTLGISLESADVTVIEEGSKGFLGMGAKPARVLVSKKKTEADKVVEFLDGLFELIKVPTTIEVTTGKEDKIVFNLTTIDSSSLIGYRGEILDSIQTLASAVYNTEREEYSRIVVDCENYREKREQTLISLAQKLANKAIKQKRKLTLEPMNPFERRIIHSALADFEGVKTVSEGKEPNRYIAIVPDNYDENAHRRRDFKKGGKGFEKKSFNKKERSSSSNETQAPKKKLGFGGGVFLGNSLKDNNND